MMKILTEKRGALQGISVQSIVRQVYGPTATYRYAADGENQGVIVRDDKQIDTVIDVHNAA
jgi:hypothetical protein